MKNFVLFLITVGVYFGGWWFFDPADTNTDISLRLVALAVLCAPININGDIWTVLGNAESEKNIYSLCSIYQKADEDALTFFSPCLIQFAKLDASCGMGFAIIQRAHSLDATFYVGIVIVQRAGKDAFFFIGSLIFQLADRDALTVISTPAFQAGEDVALLAGVTGMQCADCSTLGIGIAGIQFADEGDALVWLGVVCLQGSVYKTAKVQCGVAVLQDSEEESRVNGFALYQRSNKLVDTRFGFALFRSVLSKGKANTQTFAACSRLESKAAA